MKVVTTMSETVERDYADLAHVLFCTELRAEGTPSPDDLRSAIEAELRLHDPTACRCEVAQEAGDHPDSYRDRMRWCLNAVRAAFPSPRTSNGA